MIRKNYLINSFLLLTGLLGLNACDKYLEIDPTNQLESTYFENEERVQRGIAATYAKMCDIYGPSMTQGGPYNLMWLLPGDDITFDGTGEPLETFSSLNSSNNKISGYWDKLYQLIARCNFMLDKIAEPSIQSVYQTNGLMEANRGEMLFLRSWCNYKLWDYFRKAPLQLERIRSIEESILAPTSGFELLDEAISSLEEAANLLPESWESNYEGRITKDGAYGLLVKCYVLRACYNDRNSEDYNKAIDAFNKISSSRQLVIPYGENFDYRTENNVESLFEFQATQAATNSNAWLDNDFGFGIGQMGAYYQIWNNHWGNSGKICGPSQKLINAFELGDPRMNETLSDSADNLGGKLWWIIPIWNKFNGYQMVKYIKGERGDNYDAWYGISSANNLRIIRLADVKLAVAEAYLNNGNEGEALKQVNDIRERARKSTTDGIESPVPAALVSVTMNDIMHERMVELAGEVGNRWTDLRRWHAAGYINLGTWSAADFGFNYSADLFAFDPTVHILFPIPISELERNPKMAESGNNPGY